MTHSNSDFLGEYSKLYYQAIDFDITDPTVTDAAILADLGWTYVCAVDVSVTRARTLREVVDRCVGEEKEYSGGKRDTSITINMNELRYDSTTIANWHALSDNTSIVALLVLNGDRLDANSTETWGFVGNFIIEQDDDSQPSEGNNTNTLTYKPAAGSAYTPIVRRVYGSGVA